MNSLKNCLEVDILMTVELVEVEPKRYVLKILGLPCPYPVLYTVKTLDKIPHGETLEVIFDNQPSCETIKEAVVRRGSQVLNLERLEEALWKITIKK